MEPVEAVGPSDVLEPWQAEEPSDVVEPWQAEEPLDVVEPWQAVEPLDVVEPWQAVEPSKTMEASSMMPDTVTAYGQGACTGSSATWILFGWPRPGCQHARTPALCECRNVHAKFRSFPQVLGRALHGDFFYAHQGRSKAFGADAPA